MICPSTVVWDFNGTLLDDVELTASSISVLLRRRNLPGLDVASHRHAFGFPVSGYYERLGFDLSREAQAALSDEFHEAYLAGVAACSLNDGVLELLRHFQRSGIDQFVLSAAEQSLVESWVHTHEIDAYFSGVYGLEDRLAKSKIDRGIDLLTVHCLTPARTLLIGDTDHDAEVAIALGTYPVVVLQGHQDETWFEGSPYEVFGDFRRLMSALVV